MSTTVSWKIFEVGDDRVLTISNLQGGPGSAIWQRWSRSSWKSRSDWQRSTRLAMAITGPRAKARRRSILRCRSTQRRSAVASGTSSGGASLRRFCVAGDMVVGGEDEPWANDGLRKMILQSICLIRWSSTTKIAGGGLFVRWILSFVEIQRYTRRLWCTMIKCWDGMKKTNHRRERSIARSCTADVDWPKIVIEMENLHNLSVVKMNWRERVTIFGRKYGLDKF